MTQEDAQYLGFNEAAAVKPRKPDATGEDDFQIGELQ